LNSKIKVSIIGVKGYPYVYGGYETLIKELAERLVTKNVQLTIYCHRSLFKEKIKEHNGIRLVYMPSIEIKVLSQLVHSFLCTLHACFSNSDILFYVNVANGPFGRLTRLFRKKTVINVDGMEWLRPKWKGFGARYFYFAAKQATKCFDVLVTDAIEMQKTYLELFNASSTMIAYGADTYSEKSIQVLSPWKLNENDYYLIVGRLIPDNNSDIILDAFLSFTSTKKLVIVGDDVFDDPYALGIKEKIKNNPNIIFTGYVKDPELLSALYQHCYVYFHGHEFGGTNPTLIKALAEGTCILALNTRFNQEVLQNGKFGMFFEKNAQNLTTILMEMEQNTIHGNNRVEQYKNNSKLGINSTYNWEDITEQYYQIFLNLQHERHI
jgi:glycosyltransferase involved in cell wall biosynthesis